MAERIDAATLDLQEKLVEVNEKIGVVTDKIKAKLETKKLVIKLKEKVKANIDGEILEDDKFKIEVLNKKIKIFYDEELVNGIKK